jgi:chromosomal replication initiation ATPase DnaA
MQQESGTIRTLLKTITKALKTHSIDELSSKLEKALLRDETPNALCIDFVLTRVAGLYGISKRVLMQSQQRGDIVLARKNCIVLLHTELGITQANIGKLLNRNRRIVNSSIKEFYGLTPEKNKQHRIFVENYNLVKEELKVMIEKQKK